MKTNLTRRSMTTLPMARRAAGARSVPVLLMLAAAPLFLSLGGCARDFSADGGEIGYHGPYPGTAAQETIRGSLEGRTFADRRGAFGGGNWTIEGFAVIPNSRSAGGKGPVIVLRQEGLKDFLPVQTDADVADFHLRCTGSPHPKLPPTPLSHAYRHAMKLP